MQPLSTQTPSDSWDALIEQAVRHRLRDNRIDAELALGVALERSAQHPYPYWACARTYVLLALVSADRGDATDARLCLSLAVAAIGRQADIPLESRLLFWEDLVESSRDVADRAMLIDGYQRLIALYREQDGDQSLAAAKALSRLGLLYLAEDRVTEAHQMIHQALTTIADRSDLYDPDTTSLWLALSRIALRQGRTDEAEVYGAHALKSAGHLTEERAVHLQDIRRHLAAVAMAQGRWEQAHALRTRVALSQVL